MKWFYEPTEEAYKDVQEWRFFFYGFVVFTTSYLMIVYLLGFFNSTLAENSKREISTRLVSAIHGMIAVTLGLLTIENTKEELMYKRYKPLTQYLWMQSSYMYYDTFAMYHAYRASPKSRSISFKSFVKSQPLMMVHHMVLPLLYAPALIYFRNGKSDYLIGWANLMETTIPFISTRYILLELDMKNTRLYIVNGVLLVFSFGMARIVIWYFMLMQYALYKQVTFTEAAISLPIVCKTGIVVFLAMNTFWYYKIVLIFIKSVNDLVLGPLLKVKVKP